MLFQINQQNRDVRGADAGNAACLADGHRTDLRQFLSCFQPESGNGIVIRIRGQLAGFRLTELLHLLAKNAGFARITEKPVQHQKRKYGVSKFGLERFVNGFLDLISLWFLSRFGKKPMHFFGFTGILMFLAGGFMTIWIIAEKLIQQGRGVNFRPVAEQPMFYLALLAVILGVQLFLAGFICEMVSRNSQERNKYNIKEEF